MKLSKQDLPLIRGALLLLVATAMIAGVAVWSSGRLENRLRQQLESAQQRLAESRGKLQHVREEEQTIRRYLERYRGLAARGLIGEEQRLDWIEAIAQVKAKRKLFEIGYDISAQQPVPGLSTGGLQLRSSRMKVTLPLLHEGDLLNFLDDLEKQDRGFFVVQACQIQRNAGQPRLEGSCSLDWLTFNQPHP